MPVDQSFRVDLACGEFLLRPSSKQVCGPIRGLSSWPLSCQTIKHGPGAWGWDPICPMICSFCNPAPSLSTPSPYPMRPL